MSYIINNSRGNIVAIVPDGVTNTANTSLSLVGQSVINYGTAQNENFVYLLENFAKNLPPLNPLLGQLWYNSDTGVISTYNIANSWTALASTADVDVAITAAKISPAFSGVPTAPTASLGSATTQIATTAFVQSAFTNFSGNATLTGNSTAVTAPYGTNTTQIATTAFVQSALSGGGSGNTSIQGNLSVIGNIVGYSINLIQGNVSTVGNVFAGTNISAGGNIVAASNIDSSGLIRRKGVTLVGWTTGELAPLNPEPGDFWYNSTNDKLYQYWNDGASNQWVDQSAPTSFSNLSVTGNAVISGTLTAGTFNFPTGSNLGTISVTNITNAGANGTGNIGSPTTKFNTVFAMATSAAYADLAEHYSADEYYEPGTVVVFGGTKEITTSDETHDSRIAGVVSTDPAYIMNTQNPGTLIALVGRVPCYVQGPVVKGDRLVNIRKGVAGKLDRSKYEPGCIIGKSLETIEDSSVRKIEVVVGRL